MSVEYTIASNDETCYNRIYSYFESVNTETASIMVTGLTTNCCIKVLKIGDYLTVNDVKYEFADDYTQMSYEALVDLLNDLNVLGVSFGLDNCRRFVLTSMISGIVINDASYNVRLLMGLHPFNNLDLEEEFVSGYQTRLVIQTVGFMLSTPVLYLTSNLGQKAYLNNQRSGNIQNSRVVMRINNSFSANYPIIAGNAEFQTVVPSGDLSNVEFVLVDANMVQIELLSPMYLSVSIRDGVIDEKLQSMNGVTAGNMVWNEEMKNKDLNTKAAELKNFDVMRSIVESGISLTNARN